MNNQGNANTCGPKRSMITLWSLNTISQESRPFEERADSTPWNRKYTWQTWNFLNQQSRKLWTTEEASKGQASQDRIISVSIRMIPGTSLVAQWLRICLPMQGTWVRALVQEDPTCRGATKPVRHNYWACALKPACHNYWAHVPQLLKPVSLEPVLHNKRSHRNEKPMHCNEE